MSKQPCPKYIYKRYSGVNRVAILVIVEIWEAPHRCCIFVDHWGLSSRGNSETVLLENKTWY